MYIKVQVFIPKVFFSTLIFASFLLFALLSLTVENSSLILLLCVLVKCSNERDWPGSGGPLTACVMSRVGLDSISGKNWSLIITPYLVKLIYM